ncbi:MAG: YdiU family protein [Candidatus Synoicihabitans palmerolidicus]|nr:YdiU family protein [Candidatus Synoicihabitans palmerolidicus]
MFDNTYVRSPQNFFARQVSSRVPAPSLIRVNEELAKVLGIDAAWLASKEGVGVLAGNVVPPGADPIAQAYAGHQFGHFVPQLGDGRAILLGEVVGRDRRRRDLQLKGAGRTPYSRGGDGKAALGPVLREYVVSEAMAALGVPTTRALAAVSTGETVWRETALPGAVFVRVAASHMRVGTFQYFASRDDRDALGHLVDMAITRHYPEAAAAKNPTLALLKGVIAAQAELMAAWLGVGFIHGVLNTDNVAISGETIDYGPCAFMDTFHPQCVFSSIDRHARYAWGNQPVICQWNLTRLAETLLPLLAGSPEEAKGLAETALGTFTEKFETSYLAKFRAKFGMRDARDGEKNEDDGGGAFIKVTLGKLAEQDVDFTLFFRQLTRVASGGDAEAILALFNERSEGQTWLAGWREVVGVRSEAVEIMEAANPVLVPRNHRVEEAIQAGVRGDFAPFHRLVDALAQPYTERTEFSDLEAAPLEHERVTQTFCGT